jgi:hypothetical protein
MVVRTMRCCARCGEVAQRYGTWRYCWPCDAIVTRVRERALRRVKVAVRCGELPSARTLLCVDCGRPAFDYDHRDYDRPLDVAPVCRGCNLRRGPAVQGRMIIHDDGEFTRL